jgi:alpha-1,3-glucosyltransferase
LHMVIPFSVVAVERVEDARTFLFLSTVSTYSLFPLLFEAQEYPIKVTLLLLYALVMWLEFSEFFHTEEAAEEAKSLVGGGLERFYLAGLVVVEIYGQCLHPLWLGSSLPFLPLMLTSVYCAVGMVYFWLGQLRLIVCA